MTSTRAIKVYMLDIDPTRAFWVKTICMGMMHVSLLNSKKDVHMFAKSNNDEYRNIAFLTHSETAGRP